MTQRKGKFDVSRPKDSQVTNSAFDVWLSRSLHELFDEVANEPIPENLQNLLKLMEDENKN